MKYNDPRTKDYHVASVEEYIGDSGKEFEGAAEKIVESYMGEYMQVIIEMGSQDGRCARWEVMDLDGCRSTCKAGILSTVRRLASSATRSS